MNNVSFTPDKLDLDAPEMAGARFAKGMIFASAFSLVFWGAVIGLSHLITG